MEIQGYENYLIYPDGRVYSKKNDKFLKPGNRHGYYHITLCKDGKPKTHFIHRLMGKHYIPNPNNKPVIDHINRIRNDNRIENLRWATVKENIDNTGMLNTNTSGHRCISYDKAKKKWKFQKIHYGKHTQKRFKTKTDALCYKFIFLLMLKAEIVPSILPLK